MSNTFKNVSFVVVAALAVGGMGLAFGAGNDSSCVVSYSSAVKGETARSCNLQPDGGPKDQRPWTGATLLMQCSSDVYGSATQSSSTQANNLFPDAGILDFKYSFSSSTPDPVVIFLTSNQSDFTVLGVSTDGGCKFAPYVKRN